MYTDMPDDAYRKALLRAILTLDSGYEEVFDAMLNVMVKGEWREWDETMTIGDEIVFTEEMFEGSADANVQQLLKLLVRMRTASESLATLNNISDEELEEEARQASLEDDLPAPPEP